MDRAVDLLTALLPNVFRMQSHARLLIMFGPSVARPREVYELLVPSVLATANTPGVLHCRMYIKLTASDKVWCQCASHIARAAYEQAR